MIFREEKRTLERELARIKVSANRVEAVVPNEWKDDNDKVMPIKQWLEERRFFQAEIQRLKDKLTLSERTAKAEAHLKDRLRMRLKTLEEGLKQVPNLSINLNAPCGSRKTEKPNYILGFLSNNAGLRRKSTSQPMSSVASNKASLIEQPNLEIGTANDAEQLRRANSLKLIYDSGEKKWITSLWASRLKMLDNDDKKTAEMKENSNVNVVKCFHDESAVPEEIRTDGNKIDSEISQIADAGGEDMVSGFLYDRLQREVINLRKYCEEKDATVNAKDEEIKMLMKKVDTLARAMEIESKKMKREAAARERELSAKMESNKQKIRSSNFSRRFAKTS